MGQDTQIDLGIITSNKNMSLLRYKCLADALAFLGADRDILQIRLAAGKPAGCSNGLVERGMHPACPGVHQAGQFLHIG